MHVCHVTRIVGRLAQAAAQFNDDRWCLPDKLIHSEYSVVFMAHEYFSLSHGANAVRTEGYEMPFDENKVAHEYTSTRNSHEAKAAQKRQNLL